MFFIHDLFTPVMVW